MQRAMFAILAVVMCASLAPAQPASEPASQPTTRPMLGGSFIPVVTRADLADAYVRLERALHDHPPAADDLPRVSRAYDRAAMQFFTGRLSDAVATMNDLTDSLQPPAQRTDAQHADVAPVIRAIKVRVAPPVAMRGRPGALRVKLSPLYPVPLDAPLPLRVVIRWRGENVVLDEPVEVRPDAALPMITRPQPENLNVGWYSVQLVDPKTNAAFDAGRWYVTETPLDVQRVANERALLGVDTSDPALFQALVAVHARNALLSDSPGESESARFLVDPIALSRDVAGEINSLLHGRDPFKNRAGDYWRVIPAGTMQMPARIYAPERALADGKPLPLLIALHGAGADENAFMDGYGGGEIKRLADKHRFLVVSPSTYWCTPNPAALKGIIDTLAFDYPIDRSRVYLLGHSLGALAAATMSQRDPDDVAAVALLAAKDFQPPARQIPPTLLVAAQLDPVFDPLALESAARRAQAAHLPVEFEMMHDYGHCNMPTAALPHAVDWLLAHRRGASKK